jgi:hypothetical protein
MPIIDGYAASADSTTYEEGKRFSIHHSLADIANVVHPDQSATPFTDLTPKTLKNKT